MTPTGKSNRHCFMNAYLAAIPWQSTPSLFLRCRAPGEPRPTPCAIASAQPPILPPCAHPVQPASSTPGHWPPSLLRSPSALTGVSPPPPERALAPGPPSPPRPGIRACSLVFVPFLPPHWVNLTNQECPFLSGYLKLTAPAHVFQLCLAHQLRDLQRVIDGYPQEHWAIEMQTLYREAIHLRNRFEEMTLVGLGRRVTQIENQLDQLLEEPVLSNAARKLQNRYWTHRDKLLTFLYYPEVPPTNNASEQALRGSVVHRKVTNGFRSEWGAKAYAALQTVITTAKHTGEDIFQALVKLMGTPVLPFLEGSSP